jgi:hypothetical protein
VETTGAVGPRGREKRSCLLKRKTPEALPKLDPRPRNRAVRAMLNVHSRNRDRRSPCKHVPRDQESNAYNNDGAGAHET